MTFLISLAGLGAIGLTLLFHAVLFAPEGEEDAQGFRLTVPEKPEPTTQEGSLLTPADLLFFN